MLLFYPHWRHNFPPQTKKVSFFSLLYKQCFHEMTVTFDFLGIIHIRRKKIRCGTLIFRLYFFSKFAISRSLSCFLPRYMLFFRLLFFPSDVFHVISLPFFQSLQFHGKLVFFFHDTIYFSAFYSFIPYVVY